MLDRNSYAITHPLSLNTKTKLYVSKQERLTALLPVIILGCLYVAQIFLHFSKEVFTEVKYKCHFSSFFELDAKKLQKFNEQILKRDTRQKFAVIARSTLH